MTFVPRGFTSGQQGRFRPLVDIAWTKVLSSDPELRAKAAVDKGAARRAWYERELKEATGKPSTKYCDRKRDFTRAAAHFEAIGGEGIYWQLKLYGDDARRIAWNIRELCRANEVDEDYMRGVARNMLRLADDCPLPPLESMTDEQLLIIMGELKRFLRRGGRPHVKQGKDPDPF